MADEATPVAAPAAAPVAAPAVAAPAPVAAAPAVAAPAAAAPVAPEPLKNLFDEPTEKPPEAKPAEEVKKPEEVKEPPKAEDYNNLKVPEGAALSDEVLSGVKASLAELSVPPDQAQPLFDKFVAGVQAASKAAIDGAVAKWQDTQREWQAEARKDPEIGGAKFDQSIADTRKGAMTLLGEKGAKALFEALNVTGAGNQPDVVRALHKAFSIHAPSKPVVGGQPAGQTQRSAASTLYPTQAGLGNAALTQ